MTEQPVWCQAGGSTDKTVEVEGIATLLASGVRFQEASLETLGNDPAILFAAQQSGAYLAGHISGAYWRELFALAGPERAWSHAGLLASAFDLDEELVFDPDQLLNYSS